MSSNPPMKQERSNATKTDKPKPHVCATCTRSFARLEHLKRHERSHTKEKPFECPVCERCFARRDLLLRHQQKLHASFPIPRSRGVRKSNSISTATSKTAPSDGSNANSNGAHPRIASPIDQAVNYHNDSYHPMPMDDLHGFHFSHSDDPAISAAFSSDTQFAREFFKKKREPPTSRSRAASFSAVNANSYTATNDQHSYADNMEGPPSGPSQIGFSTPQLLPLISDGSLPDIDADFLLEGDYRDHTMDHLNPASNMFINPALLESSPSSNPSSSIYGRNDDQIRRSISVVSHHSAGAPNNATIPNRSESIGMHNEHMITADNNPLTQASDIAWMYNSIDTDNKFALNNQNNGHQQNIQHITDGDHETNISPGSINSHPANFPYSMVMETPGMHSRSPNSTQNQMNVGANQTHTDGARIDLDDPKLTLSTCAAPFTNSSLWMSDIDATNVDKYLQQDSWPFPNNDFNNEANDYGMTANSQERHPSEPNPNTLLMSSIMGKQDSSSPTSDHRGSSGTPNLNGMEPYNLYQKDNNAQNPQSLYQNHVDIEKAIMSSLESHTNATLNSDPSRQMTAEGSGMDNIACPRVTPQLRLHLMTTLSTPTPFTGPTIPSLPSTLDLQRYIHTYTRDFGRHLPFLHTTFSFTLENSPLLLAMSAIGALYEFEPVKARRIFEASRRSIHVYLEGRRLRNQGAQGKAEITPIWLVQCLILGVVFGLFCGDPVTSEIAAAQTSAVVSLSYSAGLHRSPAQVLGAITYASLSLEDKWKYFIEVQTRIRTFHAVHVFSAMLATGYNVVPGIHNEDLSSGCPCEENLWMAPSAEAWWSLIQDKMGGGSAQYQNGNTDQNAMFQKICQGGDYKTVLQSILHSPVSALSESLSAFTLLSLIYSLHTHIYDLRLTHLSGTWQMVVRQMENSFRAWETAWSLSPYASLSPTSRYGPLMPDSIPLLSLAHVHLYVDLAKVKECFWLRDFKGMSYALSQIEDMNSLRIAAGYAADAISLWEKHFGRWTSEVSSRHTFLHSIICIFDCGLVLGEYLLRIEKRLGSENIDTVDNYQSVLILSEDERRLCLRVREILRRIEFDQKSRGDSDVAMQMMRIRAKQSTETPMRDSLFPIDPVNSSNSVSSEEPNLVSTPSTVGTATSARSNSRNRGNSPGGVERHSSLSGILAADAINKLNLSKSPEEDPTFGIDLQQIISHENDNGSLERKLLISDRDMQFPKQDTNGVPKKALRMSQWCLKVTASILDDVVIWPFTPVMAEALRAQISHDT
ncbi:hypothetical protein CANCADRAFT_3755 [Tortispora caseinolytica NRRL Y-17796]|uniref:C2H2-type domain-containing protein n=1 Tax=Tortispora caseinolytica NRRL Y-17796 TaxID=767744 RepID=A0A1E4TBJ0_9ASCO|nr:hypothetical protein CANCADRAFT_3755 [Tortispora caseinolytica NRRL Y-17796]